MTFEERLRRALDSYGWGPREGPVEFHHRPYTGWQLGNGTVETPWPDPELIPPDKETALRDIEAVLRKEADPPNNAATAAAPNKETPMAMPNDEYPNTWEEVADIERLRVPNGWLVAASRGVHRVPIFVSDPTWSWRVAEPVPVPPPPPPPPGPEAWAELCGKAMPCTSDLNQLPFEERVAADCRAVDLAVWESTRIPLRVHGTGRVELYVDPSNVPGRRGFEVCDGRVWLEGTEALRAEAERVVAAAAERLRQYREARARERAAEKAESDARRRADIAEAADRLRGWPSA